MTTPSDQTINENQGRPHKNPEQNPHPSQRDTGSSNHASSGPQKLFLVNRVSYFCLAVSLVAPVINFFLSKDSLSLGITFDLMIWILFGIIWCGGFATVMGPIFSLVAAAFRMLDVVPALGSSLWVLLSIWLTVQVINDTPKGFPAFLNNLPLFSLIMANIIAAALTLELDIIFRRANEASFSSDNDWISGAIIHSFEDGKHCLSLNAGRTNVNSLTSVPYLCVSEVFLMAYQTIRDKSVMYLRGENMEEFSTSFENWRSEARKIRRILLLRRLLCLVGYIMEASALYFSFVFLNRLKGYVQHEKGDEKPVSDALVLLLPTWQIVVVVMLSFFSHYLWVFIGVECTCTSPAEVSSLMLRKMESWTNFSCPENGVWDDRKRNWIVPWERKFREIRAVELPAIGIIADDTSLETGTKLLRSTVTGFEFSAKRIASDTIRLRRVREDEQDRESLYSESIEIEENDKVI